MLGNAGDVLVKSGLHVLARIADGLRHQKQEYLRYFGCHSTPPCSVNAYIQYSRSPRLSCLYLRADFLLYPSSISLSLSFPAITNRSIDNLFLPVNPIMYSSTLVVALASLAAAKTIVITAGQGGLVYSPDTSTAEVGDTLEFHFRGSTHTVTQGDYNTPCMRGSVSNGFFSGRINNNFDGTVSSPFAIPPSLLQFRSLTEIHSSVNLF
jgi:plastocyanin